ncbi:aminoglycoside phosphotransferase family protein [Paractinoplanes abujensis]
MPRWWGGGSEWLAGLPRLVQHYGRRWGLAVDGAVMHGSNALVVPVVRAGEPFVLRLTPPGADVGEQVAALRFWDGRGTVRLVGASRGPAGAGRAGAGGRRGPAFGSGAAGWAGAVAGRRPGADAR